MSGWCGCHRRNNEEAIRNSKEVGVVSQQPYAMGYQTIWTALLTTAPKKSVEIKRNVRIDPAWIDSSTSMILHTVLICMQIKTVSIRGTLQLSEMIIEPGCDNRIRANIPQSEACRLRE